MNNTYCEFRQLILNLTTRFKEKMHLLQTQHINLIAFKVHNSSGKQD